MAVSTIVRRSVEAFGQPPNGEMPKIEFTGGWLAWMLVFTVLAFVFVLLSVEYTYGLLVPTLAAVEHPNPELFVRVDDLTPKDPSDPAEVEIVTAAPRPITSKLRTTISHLRARAGRWSRYRGLSMLFTANIAEGFLASIVPLPKSSLIGRFIFSLIGAVIVANFHVAWVHIVISEPSSKRFYQRIPSIKAWKKIMPAVVFEYALTNGAFYVTLLAIKLIHGLDEFDLFGKEGDNLKNAQSALNIISIAAFFAWVASIPARAVFIRVAASMLPEEDESIVPFDRTFGGKVVPAIVGGAGVLGVVDAWKTFDRASLKRYVMTILKAFGIEVAVTILFSIIITAEILGGALSVKGQN